MVCSRCGGKTRVIDNSNTDEENYRTRRCMKCKSEFFTVEFEVESTNDFKHTYYMNSRQRKRKLEKGK